MKIDLFLGSDLGDWVLTQVPPSSIGSVFTAEDRIYEHALRLGFIVFIGNANEINYENREIGFSIHYPRVIKPLLISKYKSIYNLHPGYLPWGRGYYPIFWAMWEQTPAGCTLHQITTGIDEGPIVAQTRVEYSEGDTGGTLFAMVRDAEKQLFLEFLPRIVRGESFLLQSQSHKHGSFHTKREFFNLKRNIDWENMTGRDLIRLIRCLSMPDYTGLEISLGKQWFEIHLSAIAGQGT